MLKAGHYLEKIWYHFRRGTSYVGVGDTSRPGANTAAVVTYAAPGAGISHGISGIAWSYDDDPTGGRLYIIDGGNVVFDLDITTGGPGFIPFSKIFSDNAQVVVTLAAGGAGISGKLNILSHVVESR